MANLDPKVGDIVSLANAKWVVIYAQGPEIRLLRLNEWSEPEPVKAPNAMTVEEAAEELGVNPKTVRDYCRTGQIKGRKVGAKWRILRSENPALATG